MDTQMQKPIIQKSSDLATILAEKAIEQKMSNQPITVLCPHCNTIPNVDIWGPNAERIIVRCKCGFVRTMELGL